MTPNGEPSGEALGGRYQLSTPLGAGGMARVVEGYDRVLERRVAVKLLRPDIAGHDPMRARERFVREARRASRLSHPNVVTVFDAGVDDDVPWIVMELVEGPTLAEVVAERGALPVAEAVGVAQQVLAGLAAAHAAGIVHRDVKPGNVLLDGQGHAKLADFGIAKAVEDTVGLTMTGQLVGTARYLSPEQVAGQAATARSDVYAVGVLLYELLAGVPPFDAETPIAIAVAHQRDPVPPLSDRRPELDAGLVAAVERALAKDPADRFPDAEAFRAALGSGARPSTLPLTGAAIAATPASDGPVVLGRAGRSAPLVLVLALVALLGVAALAFGLVDDDPSGGSAPTVAPTIAQTPAPSVAAGAPATPPAEPPPAPPSTPPAPSSPPPPPPPTAWPTDVLALLGSLQLVPDIDAYGARAAELRERLAGVADRGGRRQADDAAGLRDDVAGWVESGQLDVPLGQATIAALEPIAEGGPAGRDRGRGNQDDDDDEDDD